MLRAFHRVRVNYVYDAHITVHRFEADTCGSKSGRQGYRKERGGRWDVRAKQEPLSISKMEQLDEGRVKFDNEAIQILEWSALAAETACGSHACNAASGRCAMELRNGVALLLILYSMRFPHPGLRFK